MAKAKRTPTNAAEVLGLGGKEAAAFTGIAYARLRSLAAGTVAPTKGEAATLADAARKSAQASAIAQAMRDAARVSKAKGSKDFGPSEQRRRLEALRSQLRKGGYGAQGPGKALRGLQLSDTDYEAIFGYSRGA